MAKRKTVSGRTVASILKWHIAAYIRLSKEDKDNRDDWGEAQDVSTSIANQRKIIDDFLSEYFPDGISDVEYYVDDGISGTDSDRPEFQRMLSDVKIGRKNCIIVKNPSRAFRNHSDQGKFLEDFIPRYKVRFVSISNPFVDSYKNPDSLSGLELPILGLMNDRYAFQTSEQVRRTFNAKRKRGEFIGAFAPYGYQKDPADKNKLVIDEEAACVVRDIFHMFVYEGKSKVGIAKCLNEVGVPNPAKYKRIKGHPYNNPFTDRNDGLWNPTTIHRLIQNQMYIGHMVQGRQRIISYKIHDRETVPEEEWFIKENTHEPIVTAETFALAQARCRQDTRTANDSGSVHLLSGFIRCADCKKSMRRSANAKGGNVYYICRTNKEKSQAACTRHGISEKKLKELVFEAIRLQLRFADQLAAIVEEVNQLPVVQSKAACIVSILEGRLSERRKLQHAVDRLFLEYTSEVITLDEYRRLKETLTQQLEALEQEIQKLEGDNKRSKEGAAKDNPLYRSFQENRNISELTRGILMALVECVFVYEGGRDIEVRFKHGDQLGRVIEFSGENNAGIQQMDNP